MNNKIKIALLICIFFGYGCKECEVIPNPYHSFVLLATYDNYGGSTTYTLTIDQTNSSSAIKIDTAPTVLSNLPDNRVHLVFDGITIQDGTGVYKIEAKEDILTEERNSSGKWVEDVENTLKAFYTQELAVVLVLDVSSSLGDNDISNLKEYAVDFVESIFERNPGAEVGVVSFSDSPNILPLSNSLSQIRGYINALQKGANETVLYESMDQGLSLLNNVSADGKALVTFTDGRNNSQTNIIYDTPSFLLSNLNNSEVKSYTIGLNGRTPGGVDAAVLNDLAVNGVYKLAESSSALSSIFNSFANNIAEIYTFIYDRNRSPISNPKELKFTITAKLME